LFDGGTGNDFAWKLYGDISLEERMNLIISANPKSIDAGKVNDKLYINCLGVGFDGEILQSMKAIRFIGGQYGYLLAVLYKIFRFKETTIKNKRKANIDGTGKGIYIKNNDKMKTTTKQTTMVHNAMGGATQMRGDGHLVKGIQVPHTIREDTSTQYIGDAQGREMGGYDVTDVNAPNTNRQFTANTEHFGGVGNDGVNIKPMSYEDIYNAEIKAIRGTVDEGYTPGAMGPNNGISSDSLNVTTTRMGDIQNQYLSERGVQANKVYNSIPQLVSANLTQEKVCNLVVPNPISNNLYALFLLLSNFISLHITHNNLLLSVFILLLIKYLEPLFFCCPPPHKSN
jgi:hypothetical protein